MMIVKIHKSERRNIVSICDEELIGKKFEEDSMQLDVSEIFYRGERMSDKDVLNTVREADSLNIVGKNSIRFALKNNLIEKENIIRIKKIPHAITLLK